MKYYISSMFVFFYYMLLMCIFPISCKNKTLNQIYDSYHINIWKQHQESISKISSYQAHCVLTYNSSIKQNSIRVRFLFQKLNCENPSYRLLIINPFGFINMEFVIQNDMICLIKNKKKYYSFICDIEKMIKESINIEVPLKNLFYWVIGLPGENCNFIINSHGYLKKINFNDQNKKFIVLYNSYYTNSYPVLPKNLNIYYDSNMFYNLKIYRWIIS